MRLPCLAGIRCCSAFAYWASTTRGWCVWLSAPSYSPPGRAQLSLFPLCRWNAFVSGNPAGSVAARLGGCWLQSHQQVETARYPDPGVGGFSRNSSRFCLRRSGRCWRLSGLRRDRNCERARLGGLAQWFFVGLAIKIQNVFLHVNTKCILGVERAQKSPLAAGLFWSGRLPVGGRMGPGELDGAVLLARDRQ